MDARSIRWPAGRPPAVICPDLARPHLIGSAGAGMAPLGELLVASGRRVTGSDLRDAGHDPANLAGASAVVVSSAIPDSNPELQAAYAAGLAVVHRAQALDLLLGHHYLVGVTGTHGKTSTTAMLAHIALATGTDPTYAIGARLLGDGTRSRLGDGKFAIAEVDESDRSHLLVHPQLAIVTNIEHDHVEQYDDLPDVIEAMERFAQGIAAGGTIVINTADPGAAVLADRLRIADLASLTVVTVGTSPDDDLRIVSTTPTDSGGATVLTLQVGAISGVTACGPLLVTVPVPGRHQAVNAALAIAAAIEMGIGAEAAAEAIASYEGVDRRLSVTGMTRGIPIWDSYAHHPTEITADLQALREIAQTRGGRLLVAVQPCGLARLDAYRTRIARALEAADQIVILPVHTGTTTGTAADTGAAAPDGADVAAEASHALAAAISKPGRVHYTDDPDDAAELLARAARRGDVLVTMGGPAASHVGPLAEQQLARLIAV